VPAGFATSPTFLVNHPVSTPRSSNRTCRIAASGSPTQFGTITHTASYVETTATNSLRSLSDREDHGGPPSADVSHATTAEPAARVQQHHLPGSRPVAQTDSMTSFADSSPRGSFDRPQEPSPDGTRATSTRPISRYLSFERETQKTLPSSVPRTVRPDIAHATLRRRLRFLMQHPLELPDRFRRL
jgi:hypothetical protein